MSATGRDHTPLACLHPLLCQLLGESFLLCLQCFRSVDFLGGKRSLGQDALLLQWTPK
jgi:hypothetical protein